MATMPPTVSFDKVALDLGGHIFRTPGSALCMRSLLVLDPRTAADETLWGPWNLADE